MIQLDHTFIFLIYIHIFGEVYQLNVCVEQKFQDQSNNKHGNQSLGSMGANHVGRDLNLTIAVWRGDLIVGNPRDPSHLRIRELWIRVVVSPTIV